MFKKIFKYVGIALLILLFFSFLTSYQKINYEKTGGGKGKIALIKIQGLLLTGTSTKGGLFKEIVTGSDTITKLLDEACSDTYVKTVLLRVNSPGGSVAASQEILAAIDNCKLQGKKVVVSMGDIAASGAYYLSSGADEIIANPRTLTGSIGVIWSIENIKSLYDKIGIQVEILKKGKFKDAGNPLRKMTAEERQLFTGLLNNAYEQFITDVARERKIKLSELKKIADGRILTGEQALKYNLVDKLGSYNFAIQEAAKLGKIEGKPYLQEYKEKESFLDIFMGAKNYFSGAENILKVEMPFIKVKQFSN